MAVEQWNSTKITMHFVLTQINITQWDWKNYRTLAFKIQKYQKCLRIQIYSPYKRDKKKKKHRQLDRN